MPKSIRSNSETFNQPTAARELAKFDSGGRFRPLKTAPTLRRGWRIELPNVSGVRETLDYFYPAAIGNRVRFRDGAATPVPLRITLERQTGIYRVTALMTDAEVGEVIQHTCHEGCLRKIEWALDGYAAGSRGAGDQPDIIDGGVAAGLPRRVQLFSHQRPRTLPDPRSNSRRAGLNRTRRGRPR